MKSIVAIASLFSAKRWLGIPAILRHFNNRITKSTTMESPQPLLSRRNPWPLFLVLLGVLGLGWLLISPAWGWQETTTYFSPDGRIPWNSSRVVGSPEPPPPFRAERAFPKVQFDQPLYIAREPGSDRLLVVQQDGKIYRFAAGNKELEKPGLELFLDTQREAYGLTFHPKFAQNGYMYVVSNGPRAEEKKKNRVSRFTVGRQQPFACDPKSELIVLEWESNGHNGGDLVFGLDGMLYIPAGDGTTDSDTSDTGQDLDDLNATLIRIDVDRTEEGKSYAVPRDNPFLDVPGARPEIWAYGFRNPWRIACDERTGHIWVGNIGQDHWEMIHLVRRGDNYGWSSFEGSHPFHAEKKPGPTPIVKPTIEHHHAEARSITGGIVYYGEEFPELQGVYLYGDYSTGRIWGVKHDGEKITFHKELADTVLQILGFGVGPKGEILIVDYAGGIYRLTHSPREKQPFPFPFPRKLSETGLYLSGKNSIKDHRLHPALIPYSVAAPLWSDGAIKERFIALPGESLIEMTPNRGWNCPEGTVLVKTFQLEMEKGNRRSRRRIETRLLTKQQGEWQGYSYLWNDEQTDAVLVEAKGMDREYAIFDPATGKKTNKPWHYPSRTECMVCHSRAANYVLGLSTAQMNKLHDYGYFTADQIPSLAKVGIFKDYKEPAPCDAMPKLVDPLDPNENLETRVRSYLHANCSQCHVMAGGGNAKMELDFVTPLKQTYLLDKPIHQTFGIADARIIAPGSPEKSVMYQRLSRRGQGQMPPLASTEVDAQALGLFREWILSLPEQEKQNAAK